MDNSRLAVIPQTIHRPQIIVRIHVIAIQLHSPPKMLQRLIVGTLAKAARENGITKTAIVLVGDIITHVSYNRAKLYDPRFSTGFRDAE